MTFRRSVLAALCACGAVASLPTAASAYTPAPAIFELSAGGKRALKSSALTLTTVPKQKRLLLGTGEAKIGSSATIALRGTLRFSAGKRKADATAISVTIGRTASFVSARLGGKRLKLFTVTPATPARIDVAAGTASVRGARITFTRDAAARLKRTLKLKRTPSPAGLGTLTVAVGPPPQPPIVSPPAPVPLPLPLGNDIVTPTPTPTATATATASPSPTATPVATVTPGPNLPCDASRFSATPANVLDWFGCDEAGTLDLKSWTNYIRSTPAPFCGPGAGAVTPGFGASEVVAGDPYDHRFAILSSEVRPDGSATIVTSGDITYTQPAHGIDERIGALRIDIAAGGDTATVRADGHYKKFSMGGNVCTLAPLAYAAVPVLTLDLSAVDPVTAGGVTRWVHVPAVVSEDADDRIGGGTYDAGRPWGSFTIAIPAQ